MIFSKINVFMEDMTGWCASPRGCGPRTDVPTQVETGAPVPPIEDVEPYTEPMPIEEPVVPAENVQFEQNGVAPVVQDAVDNTIEGALESVISSLVGGATQFLIFAVLIFGAFLLIKHFLKAAATRASEYAQAQKEAAMREAMEKEKVKTALATKEKIERARKKRKSDATREERKRESSTSSSGNMYGATDAVDSFDLNALVDDAKEKMQLKYDSSYSSNAYSEDPFAAYKSDSSSDAYSDTNTGADGANNPSTKKSDNPFSQYLPEKRSENPFSQYL